MIVRSAFDGIGFGFLCLGCMHVSEENAVCLPYGVGKSLSLDVAIGLVQQTVEVVRT